MIDAEFEQRLRELAHLDQLAARRQSMTLKTQKNADGTWAVVDADDNSKEIEGGFSSKKEAQAAIEQWDASHPDDHEAEEEIEQPETEEVTEHNPHGLAVHERISRIIAALRKFGLHHDETASPHQNAATTADKFARVPKDGQNSLPENQK